MTEGRDKGRETYKKYMRHVQKFPAVKKKS